MKDTNILSRNKVEPARAWWPPAPERDAAPVVIVQAQPARAVDDAAELRIENAVLKAQLTAANNALAFHRDAANKPFREVTTERWLRGALMGQATASTLPTVGTMEASLYRAEKCGSLDVIRA